MKSKNVFIGIEAEGPYQGGFVLFVPGDTAKNTLVCKFNNLPTSIKTSLHYIYLGANEHFALPGDLLDVCCSLCNVYGYHLVIESNDYEAFLQIIKVVSGLVFDYTFVFVSKKHWSIQIPNSYTKVVLGNDISWKSCTDGSIYKTKKDDFRFYFDTYCEDIKEKF